MCPKYFKSKRVIVFWIILEEFLSDSMHTRNLKKGMILLATALLMNSCTTTDKEPKEPAALALENSSVSLKRTYDTDLTESLYRDLVERTPELKRLEQEIELLRKAQEDSTKVFYAYTRKNELYYITARQHMETIRDSVLKHKMRELIAISQDKYKAKLSDQEKLLKSIEQKINTLNNLNETLKISKTIPLIEKFQKDKFPSVKPITSLSGNLDRVIKMQDSIVKK